MTRTPGTIVVALGGNALAPPGTRATIHDQFRHTRSSLEAVVALALAGWRIAVVHGNGPQVGDELERAETAADRVEPLPLGVLVASTAGWIGYMIQQSLQNALQAASVRREVITLITQTLIAEDDPALEQPTKPIGHALSPPWVERLTKRGQRVGRDGAGRWRRLVPSPRPLGVIGAQAVRRLVDEGSIVVAAGGGGPPVFEDEDVGWEGVDAVVDKDHVAAVLANRLEADCLLILTNVDAVYHDWGTPEAAPIQTMSVGEARMLLDGDVLGRGSMRPKVEAALEFLDGGGHRAVIASLQHGLDALAGRTGTTIVEDGDA